MFRHVTAAALAGIADADASAATARAGEPDIDTDSGPDTDADRALPRAGRRARGAYFTPPPLVALVVAETVGARLAAPGVTWDDDGAPQLRILDPAAGDGRFLAAAADFLADRAAERGCDRAVARAAILARCAVAIERDPKFAALARARLGPDAAVHCREALVATGNDADADADDNANDADADDNADARGGFDVVIGNPPYARSIHLAADDPALWRALRGRYAATSHGEWDLYAAFLEQALVWTRPGGQVGFVVPSRWLTAAFARRLRAQLADGAVRGIVDFGAAQLFPGATTYTSIALLSRDRQDRVAIARLGASGWALGDIPTSALSAAPWRLAVGARRSLLDRLAAAAPALGDIARIAKGAGTNADGVYVIEGVRRSGDLIRGTCKHAGEVEVEAAACRPCARGRDVGMYEFRTHDVACIAPYDGDRLWTPDQLARYPRAAAHLERCRDRLDARERGRFRGDTYYQFGRPQNLALLADPAPKIAIPDVARGGRAALDTRGALLLDSAYAIRLRGRDTRYSLAVVLAVLNSPLVALWLAETGIPLRGGYTRLKTAYLASLPLPPPSPPLRALDRRVARLLAAPTAAARDAIDEDLRCAYGIPRSTWDAARAAHTARKTA